MFSVAQIILPKITHLPIGQINSLHEAFKMAKF